MALTHNERVGRALECLGKGLLPFVTESMRRVHGDRWEQVARQSLPEWQQSPASEVNLDVQSLVAILLKQRGLMPPPMFGRVQGLLHEIRDIRNRHAHQRLFSAREADRAFDTVELLLRAIGSPEAEAIARMRSQAVPSVSARPAPPAPLNRDLFPTHVGMQRGVQLFRYLSQEANRGAAVGISYAGFVAFVHGKSSFEQVAGRHYRPSDSSHVVDLANAVTHEAGGRVEVLRGSCSIRAGMDTFIWNSQSPHDRPARAWENPKHSLPYSPDEWRIIFPNSVRRLITPTELSRIK